MLCVTCGCFPPNAKGTSLSFGVRRTTGRGWLGCETRVRVSLQLAATLRCFSTFTISVARPAAASDHHPWPRGHREAQLLSGGSNETQQHAERPVPPLLRGRPGGTWAGPPALRRAPRRVGGRHGPGPTTSHLQDQQFWGVIDFLRLCFPLPTGQQLSRGKGCVWGGRIRPQSARSQLCQQTEPPPSLAMPPPTGAASPRLRPHRQTPRPVPGCLSPGGSRLPVPAGHRD